MQIPTTTCPRCNGCGQITDHPALGAIMRELRTSKGVPLKELARKMRVTPQFVRQIERGKAPWPAERLEQALRILGDPATGTRSMREPRLVKIVGESICKA